MKQKEEEKCCGGCCWFKFEDTDGWGQCVRQDICDSMNCSDLCTTDEYVSNKTARHYMAVMLQHTRWLNDHEYLRYAPNGDELDEAIAFAYKYIKTFSKL